MIGIIRSVDGPGRRCSVEVSDATGNRLVPDVYIGEAIPGARCTPETGTRVEISSTGGEWYISKYFSMETDRAQEEGETMDQMPGDTTLGGFGEAKVGTLKGGIAVVMADGTTGVMASKSNGAINVLGKTIALLNNLYQKTIVDSGIKLRIEELISGPLALSAKIKRIIDTLSMEDTTSYEGFKTITIKIDKELVPGAVRVGTDIVIEQTTLSGQEVKLTVDGITGDLVMQAGLGTMRCNALTGVWSINSDGLNPLEGVVTGETLCQWSKLPHCGVSTRVRAGK